MRSLRLVILLSGLLLWLSSEDVQAFQTFRPRSSVQFHRLSQQTCRKMQPLNSEIQGLSLDQSLIPKTVSTSTLVTAGAAMFLSNYFAKELSEIFSLNEIASLAKKHLTLPTYRREKVKESEQPHVHHSKWKVCTFLEKEDLGRNQFVKYKFQAPGIFSTLNTEPGRKVILSTVDEDNQPVKGSYFAVSSPENEDVFEIVLPIAQDIPQKAVPLATRSSNHRTLVRAQATAVKEDRMGKVLGNLQDGDEVAWKVDGRSAFSNPQMDQPINAFTLVVSDLGILPVLQLLRHLLHNYPDNGYDLTGIEMLWINPVKSAFIYNRDVSALEQNDILNLVRVVDPYIHNGGKFSIDQRLFNLFSPPDPGRMIVLAGKPRVVEQFLPRFVEQQHERKNILTIQT